MSVLGVVRWPAKQPYEKRPYQLDVRPHMLKGQVINGVGARIYVKGTDPETEYLAEMLDQTAYDSETGIIQVRTMDTGTDGTTYRVRIRWTTTDGAQYEAEAEFKVKEVE